MMHDHHQLQGITAQLSLIAGAAANPRVAERQDVDIGAGLRPRGASGVSVQILDLSTHGFRAFTHLDFQEGADVWLKLPGLEALLARVAWMDGYLVGGKFLRPLHPAVLDMVVVGR